MIILLTGDNIYEIDQELARLSAGFEGEVERLDADRLEPRNLTDILSGVSLFSAERLVILRRASENAALWEALGEHAAQDTDTTLVLVEPKVDKRTKTYKALAKSADVRVFAAWGERDAARAEKWLADEAKARDIILETAAAREIVRRRGVEQYQLLATLEQLSVFSNITLDIVDTHIEKTPTENVFALLEAAISGDSRKIHTMIQTLKLENDPYMTMGLLASQAFALAGLVLGDDKPQGEIAKDLGVSPFVLRNLTSSAKSIDQIRLSRIVNALAIADIGLKSSAVNPWIQIETALSGV